MSDPTTKPAEPLATIDFTTGTLVLNGDSVEFHVNGRVFVLGEDGELTEIEVH